MAALAGGRLRMKHVPAPTGVISPDLDLDGRAGLFWVDFDRRRHARFRERRREVLDGVRDSVLEDDGSAHELQFLHRSMLKAPTSVRQGLALIDGVWQENPDFRRGAAAAVVVVCVADKRDARESSGPLANLFSRRAEQTRVQTCQNYDFSAGPSRCSIRFISAVTKDVISIDRVGKLATISSGTA